MKETYKMTNWDAKKAFSKFYSTHRIYIDEYWDYYIKEYDLQDKWNTFLDYFVSSGFTYESFINEYNTLLNSIKDIIYPQWTEEMFNKCDTILQNVEQKIPSIDISLINEGKYIYVDLKNAHDTVQKFIGLLGENYNNTYDIVDKLSDNKIFNTIKMLKFDVYNYNRICKYVNYIYRIQSEVLTEKIYTSGLPIIEHLNSKYKLIGKTRGDSYLYEVKDDEKIDDMLREYTYENIQFHIDILTSKNITMFGNEYKLNMITDKQNKIKDIYLYTSGNKVNFSVYPFALKLATGEELNEKDLVVGYEDQIFFHFDKSDIL